MEKFDLTSLNKEQLEALYVTEGPVLVTAGAGSGKTRLLTHRIIYLLKEKNISPYEIIAITFTNKAANEMKERVISMDPHGGDVWISTFHSMCVRILRNYIQYLEGYNSNFSIYSDSDKEKLVKDILKEKGLDEETLKKQILFHISNRKNAGVKISEYATMIDFEKDSKKIIECISSYEDMLRSNNALDFDDLLIKTNELFDESPEVLEKLSSRFKYILVDEFQDTNKIQYDIVKKLASVHGNIFVVGDEDQCIYSWRGANFANIFAFKEDFKDVQVFKLERNYRSTPNILKIANNVIANNKSRLEKKLWTEKSEGEEPEIYNAFDEREEAIFVAKKISEMRLKGYDYKDMAILMRLNALSRPFEEALLSYNIPYTVFGGFKFYERAEIKNIISYLRLFVNPADDVSFLRIINFPKRGIGDGAIKKLKDVAGGRNLLETTLDCANFEDRALCNKFQSFTDIFVGLLAEYGEMPLDEFVKLVISTFNIRGAFNNKTEEDQNKLLNIDSFIVGVSEFHEKNPLATLNDYLESITLVSDIDSMGEKDSVALATVHAVKGLEFKVVFVVGLEESIFPVFRAFNSNEDMEEERRLIYVAITRAEEKLYLSNCSKRYMYGTSKYMVESRFLKELGMFKQRQKILQETKEKLFNIIRPDIFKKTEEEKPRKDVSVYKVGQQVAHPKYGVGEIKSISEDGLVGDIDFDGFGIKSLMLDIAPLEIMGG